METEIVDFQLLTQDLDCDLYHALWYVDSTESYDDRSISGLCSSLCTARFRFTQTRAFLVEAVVKDATGLECSVDWVITVVAAAPTATSTPTPTHTPTATATPSLTPTRTPAPPACTRVAPSQREVTAPYHSTILLQANAVDPDCDLSYVQWLDAGSPFRRVDIAGCTHLAEFTAYAGEAEQYLIGAEFRDARDQSCYVDWLITVVNPTPIPTPSSTPAPPVCTRYWPSEREVTAVVGANVTLYPDAEDADCDLSYLQWFIDGALVYSQSLSGCSHHEGRAWPVQAGAQLYEAVVHDTARLTCSVDWLVTGVAATPTTTATPTATATATATPTPDVRITALQYSGTDEYIQITNNGPGTQNMSGWYVKRVLPVPERIYTFPSGYSLTAGAYVRVHSGPAAINSPPTHLLWTTDYVWGDSSGQARLYDAAGVLVSTWTYK